MAKTHSSEQVRERFVAAFPEESGMLAHWLWNDISILHLNWTYYTQLFATDEASILLMNTVAPSFFSMVDRTLRADNLLRICRITDPSFSNFNETMENASLPRLVARTAEFLPSEVHQEVKELLSQLDLQRQPLRDLRNKRLAHSDLDEVLKLRTEPLPGISPRQVEDLIALITKTFSLVEGHFLDSETGFAAIKPSQPVGTILWTLRNSLKYKEVKQLVLKDHLEIHAKQ